MRHHAGTLLSCAALSAMASQAPAQQATSSFPFEEATVASIHDAFSAPVGVPVGAELLGLDYTEPKLLALAYPFEQATQLRKLPPSTPPLPNEP